MISHWKRSFFIIFQRPWNFQPPTLCRSPGRYAGGRNVRLRSGEVKAIRAENLHEVAAWDEEILEVTIDERLGWIWLILWIDMDGIYIYILYYMILYDVIWYYIILYYPICLGKVIITTSLRPHQSSLEIIGLFSGNHPLLWPQDSG